MSTQQFTPGGASKKAVHVKWAGKTIALGTFPAAEADEKCARAKALTRAWRSTMRPKPSREWVMLELERLNVRVVSGRLGRKGGEEGEEEGGGQEGAHGPSGMDRKNSIGWTPSDDFDTLMQRRSSSLGFGNRSNSLGLGVDDPSRRPFVGGGSAAAYEAARADHYSSLAAQKGRGDDQGRMSMGGGGPGGGMGMSVNPNQHYEMLKLHHMNLLNEIQETTLMMNLYQQQQLQQQQQQLQQGSDGPGGDSGGGPMNMMQSPGGGPPMDSMYGGAGGPGGYSRMGGMEPMGAQRSGSLGMGMGVGPGGGGPGGMGAGGAGDKDLASAEAQHAALDERLQKIKDEIAKKQKEAEELEAAAAGEKAGGKRKADKDRKKEEEEGKEPESKKVKTEKSDSSDEGDGEDDDEKEDGDESKESDSAEKTKKESV